MRKDKSGQQSLQLSQEEMQRRNAEAQKAGQGLSPYLAGSDTMSEYGRGLRSSLATSTANAGENALSGIARRAEAAGFGPSNPYTLNAQAAQSNVNAQRQADIPRQVIETMAPLELQAAGQQTNLAHLYDPEAYYQQYAQSERDAANRRAQLWGSLAGIGSRLIKPRF